MERQNKISRGEEPFDIRKPSADQHRFQNIYQNTILFYDASGVWWD